VVLWSEFLTTDPVVWVRFPPLPDFLRCSGSGTGSTQPREHNWGATWKKYVTYRHKNDSVSQITNIHQIH
jgi:hypothetical protein